MLLDTGKFGSMREFELTNMRSVLLFLMEYPTWKNETHEPKIYVPGDQTDFA
mgnify:FL=1